MKLLQVDFNYPGVMGDEMSKALVELAESINEEPGFIWKIWTENTTQGLGGGVYLFDTEIDANNYLKKHTERLQGMGVTGVRAVVFDINTPLTHINRGPVSEEKQS